MFFGEAWMWDVLWWSLGHGTPKRRHLGYWIFKLRSLKRAEAGHSLGPSSTLFPWNRSWDPSLRYAPSTPRGKEHPYLWAQRDTEESDKQIWVYFPQSTALTSYSWPITFSTTAYLSSNLTYTFSGLFLWVFLSLQSLLCHMRVISNLYAFRLLLYLHLLNFSDPARDPKMVEKSFSFPILYCYIQSRHYMSMLKARIYIFSSIISH